jgi:prephenate dehydrogenase
VIVDVATVKVHTVEILERLASDRQWIAMHPMFGPESFKKTHGDISGYRIVLAAHTIPEAAYASLRAFLTTCGFTVIEMDAQQHDRQLAETLFLTHYIGQIITHAGFERTDIDTVSFGYLMNAVESVRNDEELFKDVFKFNPYCAEILSRFETGEREVQSLLASSIRVQ